MKPLRTADVLTHPADDFLFWNFLLWLNRQTCSNTGSRSWHLNTFGWLFQRSALLSPFGILVTSLALRYLLCAVYLRIPPLVSLFWNRATVLNYAGQHLWDAHTCPHQRTGGNHILWCPNRHTMAFNEHFKLYLWNMKFANTCMSVFCSRVYWNRCLSLHLSFSSADFPYDLWPGQCSGKNI